MDEREVDDSLQEKNTATDGDTPLGKAASCASVEETARKEADVPAKRRSRVKVVKRVAYDAIFAALALAMFVVEAQIPLPLPIPGVKLGLSNIVSLFATFALGPVDAAIILLVRIGLGSLFSGSLTAFLYSLAGGVACYLVTLLLYFVLSPRQIWVAGVFGAVTHVSAQVAVAAFLTSTLAVFYYLPVLVAISVGTGLLTGLLAQFTYLRTHRFFADYHVLPYEKRQRKKPADE